MDAHDNDRLPSSDSDHPPRRGLFALPYLPSDWLREIPLHAAAAAFLAEYETYQKDPNSVIFNPTPAVLEALRKSIGAQS